MAVLKHTSPTACPLAPKPKPSSTGPSARTRAAVAAGSAQAGAAGCESLMRSLNLLPNPRPRRGDLREAIAVLREKINEAMKAALKAQDKLKLSTLRLVNAAIKNADIELAAGKGP